MRFVTALPSPGGKKGATRAPETRSSFSAFFSLRGHQVGVEISTTARFPLLLRNSRERTDFLSFSLLSSHPFPSLHKHDERRSTTRAPAGPVRRFEGREQTPQIGYRRTRAPLQLPPLQPIPLLPFRFSPSRFPPSLFPLNSYQDPRGEARSSYQDGWRRAAPGVCHGGQGAFRFESIAASKASHTTAEGGGGGRALPLCFFFFSLTFLPSTPLPQLLPSTPLPQLSPPPPNNDS